jgi:antitoxin (DNA-binding transcriptional repressor) of toxin-antitoxin stability system
MMILADVQEAAERLEEPIELARQDEVYVCRDGRPVAALTALSSSAVLGSDQPTESLGDGVPAASASKIAERGKASSLDDALVLLRQASLKAWI